MNILLIILGLSLVGIGIWRIVSLPNYVHNPEKLYTQSKSEDYEVVVEDSSAFYGIDDKIETPTASTPTTTTAATVAEPEPAAISKPETEPQAPAELSAKEKGNNFENFVANLFKNKSVFKVLEWNQGQTSTEGVYAENDKNPDFKIQQTLTDGFKVTYWMECKYRSSFDDGGNITISDYQLERYRKIQRESHRKVLIAVGIGADSKSPASFFLVPLDSIYNEKIAQSKLAKFKVTTPSTSTAPWVEDYFVNWVFKKKRTKE